MRTSVLATLLGLSLVACAGNISGGGGDDDDIPETCGNGVIDVGEDCDGGEGCSATCTSDTPVPRVALSVDTGTLTGDLEEEKTVTITATSEMGFTGGVVLSASVVDAANATVTGWTTEFSTTTLDLTSALTATATLKIVVPGDNDFLAGTVKVSASSSAAPTEANIGMTANPVTRVSFTANGNNCVYPRAINNPYRLKVGRQIMVTNGAAAGTMRIHVTPEAGVDFPHQAGTIAPGETYASGAMLQAGGAEFYCHDQAGSLADPGNNFHSRLEIVP
jgi:hypothetical protein